MLISSHGLPKAVGLDERTGSWLLRRPSSLLHPLSTLVLAISAKITWTHAELTSCHTSIPKEETCQEEGGSLYRLARILKGPPVPSQSHQIGPMPISSYQA